METDTKTIIYTENERMVLWLLIEFKRDQLVNLTFSNPISTKQHTCIRLGAFCAL